MDRTRLFSTQQHRLQVLSFLHQPPPPPSFHFLLKRPRHLSLCPACKLKWNLSCFFVASRFLLENIHCIVSFQFFLLLGEASVIIYSQSRTSCDVYILVPESHVNWCTHVQRVCWPLFGPVVWSGLLSSPKVAPRPPPCISASCVHRLYFILAFFTLFFFLDT